MYTKSEWRFRSVSNAQIFHEQHRIVSKHAWRISKNSPFIFTPKRGGAIDYHNAKMAAIIYHLRYIDRWKPETIQRRLALRDIRLAEIIGAYPWYPGITSCG